MNEVVKIFEKRGVTAKEADQIWASMAALCLFQIASSKGLVADFLKKNPEGKEIVNMLSFAAGWITLPFKLTCATNGGSMPRLLILNALRNG